jgi:hypothetical protein
MRLLFVSLVRKIMPKFTFALALGTALSLCTAAQAGPQVYNRKTPRGLIKVPVVAADPYWPVDYNIVPRYRYRPQDDRVDTSRYAKPVAPGEPEPGPLGPYSQ